MRFMVTGGAGFIGSAFVRRALAKGWAKEIVVLDALTYAGNAENLASVAGHPGFRFVRGDIRRPSDVYEALGSGVDGLFHFAAESHVDRSISSAAPFVETNVLGTQVLLDAARDLGVGRFVHVSTDEVYGSLSLDNDERFVEQSPLAPSSPYSASKAAGDHMVLAAHRTHGLNTVITRCSNNYGPFHFPEKFIPLFITRALMGEKLPLYGDGKNVRDWIWVDDHVDGVHLAFTRGEAGEVYNLGGNCERSNRDIAHQIVALCGVAKERIEAVPDRLGHDRRYAIDASYAKAKLGFNPGPPVEQRLEELVAWYRANKPWWQAILQGTHQAGAPAAARMGFVVPSAAKAQAPRPNAP